MDERRMLIPAGVPEKAVMRDIVSCNAVTARYGLVLSAVDAAVLVRTREEALVHAGRVEFEGGTVEALILAFCDSPYLSQEDYADTLCELTRVFYDFKTNARDEVDDAEAISLMRRYFEAYRGAMPLLESRMETAARNVRFGRDAEDDGEGNNDADE